MTTTGLHMRLAIVPRGIGRAFYLVHHFLEVDSNFAKFQVRVLSGVVNERRELALSHLARAEAEHEEQRVNDIGLPRTVGPDY